VSKLALGHTQSPIQWVTGALAVGVKWRGREADYSPPSIAKFKKVYRQSPICLRGVVLVKEQGLKNILKQ
jgi:hypothetical protein